MSSAYLPSISPVLSIFTLVNGLGLVFFKRIFINIFRPEFGFGTPILKNVHLFLTSLVSIAGKNSNGFDY